MERVTLILSPQYLPPARGEQFERFTRFLSLALPPTIKNYLFITNK